MNATGAAIYAHPVTIAKVALCAAILKVLWPVGWALIEHGAAAFRWGGIVPTVLASSAVSMLALVPILFCAVAGTRARARVLFTVAVCASASLSFEIGALILLVSRDPDANALLALLVLHRQSWLGLTLCSFAVYAVFSLVDNNSTG